MNYNSSTNFNFKDMIKEAKLSLGPHKTFQELGASTSSLQVSHLPLLEPANKKSNALALDEAYYSNPDNSTCQEPVHSNEIQTQKRKKIDEVDTGHILPEGSHQNQKQDCMGMWS